MRAKRLLNSHSNWRFIAAEWLLQKLLSFFNSLLAVVCEMILIATLSVYGCRAADASAVADDSEMLIVNGSPARRLEDSSNSYRLYLWH